ncbi:hypothetical protein GPL21_17360 [Bradyrhizobium pachyrhizi]|uniref:Uncharacterized protein n=1 Tax=Bradyrhizobium pachyrhizi TaxID=280333 RepID=A0A844SWV2_9BRAD|nr:hypothetical protein [Bradyrhizobium pachyrhizi]MVT66870.1 hypothetical protein [Bradyrhizobium pachyrhizi]
MLDKADETHPLTILAPTIRALVEAAANRRTAEVYALADRLCDFDGTGRSIISASAIREDDGTTSIGAFFKPPRDSERHPAPRNPRRFDVPYFAALRWMDLACASDTGQGFFYQPLPAAVDGVAKYYLRYGNGRRGAGARVYVTRIIVDAGVERAARFAEEHHSYRRRDLLTVAQHNSRLAKGEHGRSQAVRLACEMFNAGRVLPEEHGNINAFEYEALLLDMLKYADAFHTNESEEG